VPVSVTVSGPVASITGITSDGVSVTDPNRCVKDTVLVSGRYTCVS